MNKILLILFTLCLSSRAFAKKQSLSYGILTKSGFCSATLIKAGGSCKLVTNAHCISEGETEVLLKSASDYMPNYLGTFAVLQGTADISNSFESRKSVKKDFFWRYEQKFFSEKETSNTKVKVLASDRTKDMALLDVPMSVKTGGCKDLNELWMVNEEKITEEPTSVVLSGFTTNSRSGKPHVKVWHTRGTKFRLGLLNEEPFYRPTKITKETSTLENVEQFLVVDNIQMLPGNSGGTAHTSKGLFVGITTRFHPTQDKVYIIPASDVVEYALHPTQTEQSIDTKNTTEQVGGNGGTDGTGGNSGTDGTGGNSGTDGGGNSGTDGTGGNSGTDGTGCVVFGSKNIFEEPYEGYLNEFGNVILAIGGNQIDGSDDLKDHIEGHVIQRDASGYPSFEIRKNILQRLSGNYSFSSSSKRYSKNKDHVLGWEELTYGSGNTIIEVSPKEIKMAKSLHIEKNSNSESPVGLNKNYQLERIQSFKVEASSDFKTIILKSNRETLTCDNRNYLKLICSGEKSSLSISLDSEKEAKARFRQTFKTTDSRTDYFFGNQ